MFVYKFSFMDKIPSKVNCGRYMFKLSYLSTYPNFTFSINKIILFSIHTYDGLSSNMDHKFWPSKHINK